MPVYDFKPRHLGLKVSNSHSLRLRTLDLRDPPRHANPCGLVGTRGLLGNANPLGGTAGAAEAPINSEAGPFPLRIRARSATPEPTPRATLSVIICRLTRFAARPKSYRACLNHSKN